MLVEEGIRKKNMLESQRKIVGIPEEKNWKSKKNCWNSKKSCNSKKKVDGCEAWLALNYARVIICPKTFNFPIKHSILYNEGNASIPFWNSLSISVDEDGKKVMCKIKSVVQIRVSRLENIRSKYHNIASFSAKIKAVVYDRGGPDSTSQKGCEVDCPLPHLLPFDPLSDYWSSRGREGMGSWGWWNTGPLLEGVPESLWKTPTKNITTQQNVWTRAVLQTFCRNSAKNLITIKKKILTR